MKTLNTVSMRTIWAWIGRMVLLVGGLLACTAGQVSSTRGALAVAEAENRLYAVFLPQIARAPVPQPDHAGVPSAKPVVDSLMDRTIAPLVGWAERLTYLRAPGLGRGYGISIKGLKYDDDSLIKATALRPEWIKIYDYPPPERLPFRVLYRVNLPRPGEDWAEWGHYRYLDAELYRGRIDAYEIGNEPNLIEEWGGNPDPAAYARLLEIAYREIKSADPQALVVSAGLAVVGGEGDPRYVNDLAFLRGMYEHGAAKHFDVLGVHPYGFSYPPEIPPDGQVCAPVGLNLGQDLQKGNPALDQACVPIQGLCFRRIELWRQIMLDNGDKKKPMWATEFGWIVRPPACCSEQNDWLTRNWQTVSEERQARYIGRAYAYAQRHWPWMEAMFLWNLDYSRYSPGTDLACQNCESMGWYSILNPDGSPRLAYKWLAGLDSLR